MNELEYIQKHPYTEAQPDIPLILSHSKLYDKEVWKKYFSGQYQFAGVRLGPPNCEWVWGWAAESRKPDEELDGPLRKETATLCSLSFALT